MKIVRVTRHALDQHLERWPDAAPTDDQRTQRIVGEVTAAIAEGRLSPKEPRFTNFSNKLSTRERKQMQRRRVQDRSLRFVWTPDEATVYLVDRRDNTVVVVTSIRPDGDSHDSHA